MTSTSAQTQPASPDASRGEAEVWQGVRDMVGQAARVSLGGASTTLLRNDPCAWPDLLAKCKFAQKVLGEGGRVLHLGAGDGLGSAVLTEFTADYLGVDADAVAVADAQAAWGEDGRRFEAGSLDVARPGFDGVVDLAAPLEAEALGARLSAIAGSLGAGGLAVVGAEITGPASAARLREAVASRFRHVLPFSLHEDRVLAGCRGDEGYALLVAAAPLPVGGEARGEEAVSRGGSGSVGAKNDRLSFGPFWSYVARRTPRRLLYTMAYYRFAARLIGGGSFGQASKRVLDVGCGEGGGTHLMAQACGSALGVDFDEDSIAAAQRNWPGAPGSDRQVHSSNPPHARLRFACEDLHRVEAGGFDAVVNFDVVEHLQPESAPSFFRGMADRLGPRGMAVVGTPNVTSKVYANAVTNAGHINLYDGPGLRSAMAEAFEYAFLFGANDEVVHTGFPPMCHYLIAVGVGPKRVAPGPAAG
ncbi:MAG: class I SAM-dependent methyltransferase [Planctomycetota bacterium]